MYRCSCDIVVPSIHLVGITGELVDGDFSMSEHIASAAAACNTCRVIKHVTPALNLSYLEASRVTLTLSSLNG